MSTVQKMTTSDKDVVAPPAPFFRQHAATLKANGFDPIPLPIGEKGAVLTGWPRYKFAPADADRYASEGVGILTARTPSIDVDVRDATIAAELDAVIKAVLRWPADVPCKLSPMRVGLAPKFLRPCQLDGAPFRKISTGRYRLPSDGPDADPHKVEILGDGQQFVAFNIHKETKQPYTWTEGDPTQVLHDWLPLLSEADAVEIVRRCEAVLAEHGTLVGAACAARVTGSVGSLAAAIRKAGDTWFEPLSDADKETEVRAIVATWTADQATDRDAWFACIRSIADAVSRGLDREIGIDIAEKFSALTTADNLADRLAIEAKMFEPNLKSSIYAAAATARKFGYVLPPDRGIRAVPPPPSLNSPTVLNAAPRAMLRNHKNKYEATLENLAYVLGTQETMIFGFDEFRGRIMLTRPSTMFWQPLTDTDMIRLRESLARQNEFAPIGKELMRDALQMVAEGRLFDSANAWVSGLEWDGVPRIDRFLATHFGAVDDEYTRAVARYMWSGLAGRVLEPGCQLDMVIALQSPQGTKKSTGLQLLAPFPDWFTDGVSLHQDDDNFKRLIRGKIIVEIAELAGLSKADINVVKRAITRRVEEWIEKWQTLPTAYKRRCMLFASTNEEKFLPPDETGQRRWLPVEIVELDRARIVADREQLWAEGAALWRAHGIQYAEAERLAKGRHGKHEQTDVWEAKINEWLTTPPTAPFPGRPLGRPCDRPLTLSEVLEGALKMQIHAMDARAEKRVARVMRQLGYETRSMKVNGESVRRWVGPEYAVTPGDT